MNREFSPQVGAEVRRLLRWRGGHFALESGHHGDVWLDLELLCVEPAPVRRLSVELVALVRRHRVDVVCGPLVEGAFVALLVAEALSLPFTYAERLPRSQGVELFPFGYQLPPAQRRLVQGKRVAVVNDVINAGSAVGGALVDLRAAGATPVVTAAFAVLGERASQQANRENVALERLVQIESNIWIPANCPLCARGMPLTAFGHGES
jgi:orotate phosphoribosyltransferase